MSFKCYIHYKIVFGNLSAMFTAFMCITCINSMLVEQCLLNMQMVSETTGVCASWNMCAEFERIRYVFMMRSRM